MQTTFEIFDYYERQKLKNFTFDEPTQTYYYPCPCGDNFEISVLDLLNNETIAYCPSCPLIVQVIYTENDLIKHRM